MILTKKNLIKIIDDLNWDKPTKLNFYKKHGADKRVLKLVKLENKRFGTYIEKIIKKYLSLEKSFSTGHDFVINLLDNKILKGEIKSSRIWGYKEEDYRWQHVMLEHDYDFLLLVGLHFDGLKIWVLTKSKLMELFKNNIIKKQGGAEGQGVWFSFLKIKNYLYDFKNMEDLIKFLLEV